MKYNKSGLEKLEDLLEKIGYKVRYEKGNFNSGYCIVESTKIIVVNKFYNVEGRVMALLEILSSLEIDDNNLDPKTLTTLKGFLKETLEK
ncbi:MAG: hypothetical protein IPN49_06640 [Saprospiraceae bacterium]|jgi:hypothetical protein|nr:hypothetical protein [Saprospiraceae bacterium]MBK6564974.1 hypothetical protein [Saprospiraceae bacterium]MBK7523612.1 hypothetical protein [Saprospiraceae bacterium]MBK8079724.1 hypothetical protein [Saprospiraceae bacterium]MBK8371397.1 hypothetical protein [Saprospiraceae bacterium]